MGRLCEQGRRARRQEQEAAEVGRETTRAEEEVRRWRREPDHAGADRVARRRSGLLVDFSCVRVVCKGKVNKTLCTSNEGSEACGEASDSNRVDTRDQ